MGGYWEWGDRCNQKPEPWRSSSSGCILDLTFEFHSVPVGHPTVAPSQQPAAITLEKLGLGHAFYNLIKPNIMLWEFLCGVFGLGHMISTFTFQLCCLDSMWRANSASAPTSNQQTSRKPGDDRKQANDFHTALTALIMFSLTKPCLDTRGFNRNCQISIRNHNSLYIWKHIRQSGVVDLKSSDLPWRKVQLLLKFLMFCHLDPACYILFLKLANLL